MVINELLLHGAIESFHVGVHLRGLGVGMVVDEMEPSQFFREMFFELRAVVGENKGHGMREYFLTEAEELRGCQRGVRGGRPCKGEAGMDVLKGDDVPAYTEHKAFDGVECDQMPGIFRLDVLWLAQYLLPIGFDDPAGAGNPLRVDTKPSAVLDEPPNGAGLGTGESTCCAKRKEQRVQFLFP